MRRNMRLFALPFIALFVTCDSGTTTTPPDENNDTVGSIAVSPAQVSIDIGQQRQLSVTVRNTKGQVLNGATISWSTSSSTVASVDQSGLVMGKASGSATVTAASGGRSANVNIIVVDPIQGAATGDIMVDPRTVYQQIVGWEATSWIGQWACAGSYPTTLFENYRDAALDSAVALGLNRVKIPFRSGAERPDDRFAEFVAGAIPAQDWNATRYVAINDNDDPRSINPAGFSFSEIDLAIDRVVQPLRQRLMARGEQLYVNLNFIDFQRDSPFEHQDHPDEYAELILAAFQHINGRYGWVPDAVEIILEPDNGPDWSPREIGEAVVATGDRLAEAGWYPDFIAPSGANMTWSLNNFDDLWTVPRVSEYLTDFAYHRYGGVSNQSLAAIGQRAVQNNVRTAMLEHIGSGYIDLHADIKTGNNSSWRQLSIGGCSTGNDDGSRLIMIDATNVNNPIVTVGSRTQFLRLYFKYIRAGAVRVEATSSMSSLDPVAFINKDGRWVVVVKAAGARDFTIGGLPAGRYGIVYTIGPDQDEPQQSAVQMPEVNLGSGQALSTRVPGRGVITIYGKG